MDRVMEFQRPNYTQPPINAIKKKNRKTEVFCSFSCVYGIYDNVKLTFALIFLRFELIRVG